MPRDALDYWIFSAGFACGLLVLLLVKLLTALVDAPWRARFYYRNQSVNRARGRLEWE